MTEKAAIKEVLMRSVDTIYPSKEALQEVLESGEKLRIYVGIDPTADYVHLGHSTNYLILKRFWEMGHKIIVLVGDFTAMIGDPSDKKTLRNQLSREEVLKNLETFKSQIGKILDFNNQQNAIEFKFNSEWLSKLNFEDVVRLASHFTVQQMIEREAFQKRTKWEVQCEFCSFISKSPINFGSIENFNSATLINNKFRCPNCKRMASLDKEHIFPSQNMEELYLHEFLYPLMQGYDSVALEADLEIGGTDQTFNMLAGRKLVKAYQNREKFVITTTLLENPVTGEKLMSKSLGTGVSLKEEPFMMYQKIMRLPDEGIIQCYIDCTELSLVEIESIKQELENGANPRDIKMRFAHTIVTMYHSKKDADMAQENFVKAFQENKIPIIEKPITIDGRTLETILVEEKIVESKSELRRLVEGNAIFYFELGRTISLEELKKVPQNSNYKIGKNRFVKLI